MRALTYGVHKAYLKPREQKMQQTLDELKAENAEVEKVEDEAPQAEPEIETTETVDEETPEPEGDAETPEEKGEEPDTEAWQKSEEESDDSSSDDRKFTSGDVAAAKRKLKARLSDSNDENDSLKAEIERLKASPSGQPTGAPKREDFYEEDDPDEAYMSALVDWKVKHSSQAAQQNAQQKESQDSLDTAIGNHYENAAKLIKETGISEETYQAADRKVRQAVDEVFPGNGDATTDQMISIMGKGSEKIMYHLGVNPKKLSELTSLLKSDPRGLKAARYIGTLEDFVNKSPKKSSQAPAPATQINGDAAVTNVSDVAKKFQQKYNKAHKANDGQAAYNIKKEAKKAGLDTSTW